jgi:hypothetical protein
MIVTIVSVYSRAPDNQVWESSLELNGLLPLGCTLPQLKRGHGTRERIEVLLKVAPDKHGLKLAVEAFVCAGVCIDVKGGQLTLRKGENGNLTETDWPEFDYSGWSHWKWKSPEGIAREERRQTAIDRFFDYADDDTVRTVVSP